MRAIFLEFQHEAQAGTADLAANGTDATMYVDGRWSAFTLETAVRQRVADLRRGPRGSAFSGQHFRGYSRSGDPAHRLVAMADPTPPAWAL